MLLDSKITQDPVRESAVLPNTNKRNEEEEEFEFEGNRENSSLVDPNLSNLRLFRIEVECEELCGAKLYLWR